MQQSGVGLRAWPGQGVRYDTEEESRPNPVKARLAAVGILILGCRFAALGMPPAGVNIEVSVLDPANQPIAGVLVQLTAGSLMAGQAETDAKGHVRFADIKAGYYNLAAGKQGYIAV